jgi:hypothetical protein
MGPLFLLNCCLIQTNFKFIASYPIISGRLTRIIDIFTQKMSTFQICPLFDPTSNQLQIEASKYSHIQFFCASLQQYVCILSEASYNKSRKFIISLVSMWRLFQAWNVFFAGKHQESERALCPHGHRPVQLPHTFKDQGRISSKLLDPCFHSCARTS